MGHHQLIHVSIIFLLINFWEIRNLFNFSEFNEEEQLLMKNFLNLQTDEFIKNAEDSQKKIEMSIDSLLNTINQKVDDPM